jgi:hypothetical protein
LIPNDFFSFTEVGGMLHLLVSFSVELLAHSFLEVLG